MRQITLGTTSITVIQNGFRSSAGTEMRGDIDDNPKLLKKNYEDYKKILAGEVEV